MQSRGRTLHTCSHHSRFSKLNFKKGFSCEHVCKVSPLKGRASILSRLPLLLLIFDVHGTIHYVLLVEHLLVNLCASIASNMII